MRIERFRVALFLLAVLVLHAGCDVTGSRVTTDMHADFNHDHRHQHGAGHDHEHEHGDDFAGGHAHPHAHGHRHGKPLHGGRIVSIGHSHHGKGEEHYHAEIMPVTEGRIVFHVLTENESGQSEMLRVEGSEIVAYVDRLTKESLGGREVVFLPVEGSDGSSFAAEIPDSFPEGDQLSVVIPKIVLGGERLTFSFHTSGVDASDQSDEQED